MNKTFACLAVAILLTAIFVSDGISQATRIRFACGRTSTSLSGWLASGARRRYVLGAREGQRLSGNVSSGNGCVKFTEGSTTEEFTTNSGDNWISVTNYCSRRTGFTLTISINY